MENNKSTWIRPELVILEIKNTANTCATDYPSKLAEGSDGLSVGGTGCGKYPS